MSGFEERPPTTSESGAGPCDVPMDTDDVTSHPSSAHFPMASFGSVTSGDALTFTPQDGVSSSVAPTQLLSDFSVYQQPVANHNQPSQPSSSFPYMSERPGLEPFVSGPFPQYRPGQIPLSASGTTTYISTAGQTEPRFTSLQSMPQGYSGPNGASRPTPFTGAAPLGVVVAEDHVTACEDECGGREMDDYAPGMFMGNPGNVPPSNPSPMTYGLASGISTQARDNLVTSAARPSVPPQDSSSMLASLFSTQRAADDGNLFDAPHPLVFTPDTTAHAPDHDEPDAGQAGRGKFHQLSGAAPTSRVHGTDVSADVIAARVTETPPSGQSSHWFSAWHRKKKVKAKKKYDACQLNWAIFAVQQKRLTITAAAALFRVPRKTVTDKVKLLAGRCPLTQGVAKQFQRKSGEGSSHQQPVAADRQMSRFSCATNSATIQPDSANQMLENVQLKLASTGTPNPGACVNQVFNHKQKDMYSQSCGCFSVQSRESEMSKNNHVIYANLSAPQPGITLDNARLVSTQQCGPYSGCHRVNSLGAGKGAGPAVLQGVSDIPCGVTRAVSRGEQNDGHVTSVNHRTTEAHKEIKTSKSKGRCRGRRQYQRELLENAVLSVQRQYLTASAAARLFQVPRRTVSDKVNAGRTTEVVTSLQKRKTTRQAVRRPRFDYEQTDLKEAIGAVRKRLLTTTQAAARYNVPKNTLAGWINRIKRRGIRIQIAQKRPSLRYHVRDLESAIYAVQRQGKTISQAASDFKVNRRTLNDRILCLRRKLSNQHEVSESGMSDRCDVSAGRYRNASAQAVVSDCDNRTDCITISTSDSGVLLDCIHNKPQKTDAVAGNANVHESLSCTDVTSASRTVSERGHSQGSTSRVGAVMTEREDSQAVAMVTKSAKQNTSDKFKNKKKTRSKGKEKKTEKGYSVEELHSAVQEVKTNELTVAQAARKYNIPKRTLFDHTMYDVTPRPAHAGHHSGAGSSRGQGRKYSQEQLGVAVEAVRGGEMTITHAAQTYNIPRRTLFDRAMGKTRDINSYNKSALHLELSVEEEAALIGYMHKLESIGQPFRRKDFKLSVLEIADRSARARSHRFNADTGPSDLWVRRFLSRHTEFRPHTTADNSSLFIKGVLNEPSLRRFFNSFEERLRESDLWDRPSQVFDCARVYFGRDSRFHDKQVATSQEACAHMCVSAAGHVLPVCMVYEKRLPQHEHFMRDMPASWLVKCSQNGEMDRELFAEWFEKIFIPSTDDKVPAILILENSEALISLKVLDLAQQHQIELVVLPSRSSRCLQPFSIAVSGPLLTTFCNLATEAKLASKDYVIPGHCLPSLWKQTIDKTCSRELLQEGFRRAGLMPFDRKVIDMIRTGKQT